MDNLAASSGPTGRVQDQTVAVTIGRVDGTSTVGRVRRVDEQLEDLLLVGADGVEERIPREALAYVAIHRIGGERAKAPEGARRYKVHVAPGLNLGVVARAPRGPEILRAVPSDPESPFGEIFLTPRGVLAIEKDEPLGAMLVRSGAVHPDVVEHAISNQMKNRAVDADADPQTERRPSMASSLDRRIGDILVARGLATADEVERAMAEQQRRPAKRLGELLLELGIVSERTLSQTLAEKFELGFVDLDKCPPDPALFGRIPADLVRDHGVVPYRSKDGVLVVVLGDPLDLVGLDRLRQLCHEPVDKVVATPRAIAEWLRSTRGGDVDVSSPSVDAAELDRIVLRLAGSGETLLDAAGGNVAGAFDMGLETLVQRAVERGATRLRIEPVSESESYRIWFKADGRYGEHGPVVGLDVESYLSRLRAGLEPGMAATDPGSELFAGHIGEHAVTVVPHDERGLTLVLSGRAPSEVSIEELGMTPTHLGRVRKAMSASHGLVLCVGAGESGKSTTLRALLGEAKDGGRFVWEVSAATMRERGGLAESLCRARRAGAEVIGIDLGDEPGALPLAVDHALSGALVVVALSAPDVVSGLMRLGTEHGRRTEWGTVLRAIVAQRLLPKICDACREELDDPAHALAALAEHYGRDAFEADFPEYAKGRLWGGAGCDACSGTGSRGRVLTQEVLEPSDAVFKAFLAAHPAGAVKLELRRQGSATLAHEAVQRVLDGAVAVEAVVR
jgi:type IV pilus assembly protein PilB